MFKNRTIQILSAWIMMLVMAFSITPKKFLHDLVADHQDDVTTAINDVQDHIDHHGFNCNCDNLVATSPFTQQTGYIQFQPPVLFTEYSADVTQSILSVHHIFSPLRGPPSLG